MNGDDYFVHIGDAYADKEAPHLDHRYKCQKCKEYPKGLWVQKASTLDVWVLCSCACGTLYLLLMAQRELDQSIKYKAPKKVWEEDSGDPGPQTCSD